MFIYNFKINGSKTFKMIFCLMLIILFIILANVVFKIFVGASSPPVSSCAPQNEISKINSKNYTNVLKAVHENIDDYIGVKFSFTGYIYRVLDLNENQFILARDMVVSSDFQSVIVGFLCEYDKAKTFKDDTWVEITGEITKGDYHGDMPIVKIKTITETNKPNDEYVYPPDETYIPTAGII